MPPKLTYDKVKDYIEGFGYTLLAKEYINNSTKMDVMCPFGHQYSVTYGKFQSGRRCPHCSNKVKISREEVVNHLNSEGYSLLSEFKNGNEPVIVLCPMGHEWKVSYQKFKKGRRCTKCSGSYKEYKGHTNWNTELVRKEMEKDKYELLEEYINSTTKVKLKCPNGHIIEMYWGHFLRQHRCRHCAGEWASIRQRKNVSDVDKELEKEGYTRIGEYVNNHEKLEVICSLGHKTSVTMGNFTRGVRCKYCSASSAEKEIMEVLDALGEIYEYDYTIEIPETRTYMYIDFVIFDENEKIKFAVEYDGRHHFETVTLFEPKNSLEDYQNRDELKNNYCRNNNIPLIRIPFTERKNLNSIIVKYSETGLIPEFDIYRKQNKKKRNDKNA